MTAKGEEKRGAHTKMEPYGQLTQETPPGLSSRQNLPKATQNHYEPIRGPEAHHVTRIGYIYVEFASWKDLDRSPV
jgi:hypothetical protein